VADRAFALGSGHLVGPGAPCLLVAEIGNNHQGDAAVAARMVEAAARAGADAVKFQKRDAAALLTRRGLEAAYGGEHSFGATYGEHRAALELSADELAGLARQARSLGLAFFASCWDMPSLETMLGVGMDCVKIASADLVNLPMLRRAAGCGLPVLLSTGMSSWTEIDAAVETLAPCRGRLALLHCNSSYPCADAEVGLPVMAELAHRYGLPVGYSGHERGVGPSVAAAALGACVVERHFTLDVTQRGTDHAASLDPERFALLAGLVREAEAALAVADKRVFPGETRAKRKLRKSVVYARNLAAGHVLAPADLALKCPGDGVSPLRVEDLPGRALTRAVRRDERFAWADVRGGEDGADAEGGVAGDAGTAISGDGE
jgi:N-acetylneuraminate synthase/sialic acid synthase